MLLRRLRISRARLGYSQHMETVDEAKSVARGYLAGEMHGFCELGDSDRKIAFIEGQVAPQVKRTDQPRIPSFELTPANGICPQENGLSFAVAGQSDEVLPNSIEAIEVGTPLTLGPEFSRGFREEHNGAVKPALLEKLIGPPHRLPRGKVREIV